MSKPIFTTDLGILSPKTVAPAAGKPSADGSASADAFEGALSTAVARQRQNEARAQQADRAQARRDDQAKAEQTKADQTKTNRDQAAAGERADSADAKDASGSSNTKNAASRDMEKKVATPPAKQTAQGDKKEQTQGAEEQAAAADASIDADADAAVVQIADDGADDGAADGDASKEETAQDDAAAAQAVVVAAQVAPAPPAQPPSATSSEIDAIASIDGAKAAPPASDLEAGLEPTGQAPTPTVGPEIASTSAAPQSAQAPEAATSSTLPTAPVQTAAPQDAPVPAPTLLAQALSGATSADEVPTPAALPPAAQTPAAQTPAAPTANAAPQLDASPAVADEALAAQIAASAALAAASQTASAPPAGAAAQQPAPAASKPFIPVESSSIASLREAIDMPTTVTYTANAPSQSQAGGSGAQSGGQWGGQWGAQTGDQSGAGFGSNNSAGRPAATPAIVTQDLALLSQTAAVDGEALPAPEPAAIIAAPADDALAAEVKTASTPSSPIAQTTSANAAFQTPAAPNAAPAAPRAHPVLLPLASQITTGMATLAKNGGGEINIHLQPANLGRVDVSMKIDEDGRMTATIAAERQDTLDLLRRDSHALERSLADAGMKTDGGGLQFSLRGEGGRRDRDGDGGRAPRGLAQIAPDQETTQASPTRRASGLSRLDMRI